MDGSSPIRNMTTTHAAYQHFLYPYPYNRARTMSEIGSGMENMDRLHVGFYQ